MDCSSSSVPSRPRVRVRVRVRVRISAFKTTAE